MISRHNKRGWGVVGKKRWSLIRLSVTETLVLTALMESWWEKIHTEDVDRVFGYDQIW